MSQGDPDSLVGRKFGEFELVERLGHGGMGAVYLARDKSLDRMVAVKVMAGAIAAEADLVQRFAREAKAAARLTHPNIVQVYRVGNEAGTPYIAMEYVEGAPLNVLLKRCGTMSWQQALHITSQVADALTCAHGSGIIHRDIKPDNIIVNQQGRAWVADFGLAKIQGADTQLTATGLFMGSPRYMSPEQCGTAPVTPASDMFSLGIVLYEMLAGRRPFVAETPAGLVKQITLDDPEPLATAAPDTPPAVRRLVDSLMAKDPNARTSDGAVLAEAIRNIGVDSTAQSEETVAPQVRPRRSRLAWTIPLVLVAALALVGVLAHRWRTPTPPSQKAEPQTVRGKDGGALTVEVSEHGHGVFTLHVGPEGSRLFPIDWLRGSRGVLVAGELGRADGTAIAVGVVEPGSWKARALNRFNIQEQRFQERPYLCVPRVPEGTRLADAFLVVHPGEGVLLGEWSDTASSPLVQVLPHNPKSAPLAAAVSPDGRRLCVAFLDRPMRQGEGPARRPGVRLVEHRLDAFPIKSAGSPLAPVSGGVSDLKYAPDGSHLAYVRRLANRRFEFRVVALREESGSEVSMTGNGNAAAFAFDPSGRSVVLAAAGDASPEPMVTWIPVSGGSSAKRSLGPGRIGASPWHPSGRFLVVMAPDDKGQDQMWRISPGGGDRVCLSDLKNTEAGGRLLPAPSGPTVSPDGRWAVSQTAAGRDSQAIVFVDLTHATGGTQ